MKPFLKICTVLLLFLFLPNKVHAIYDPREVPNNKYGIHISGEYDVERAAELVNSSGGDWGYVTLVIPRNDRNADKWQKTFDKMRELHLIPIVRIASEVENSVWKKLENEDITSWIDFLDSLNWVIENRYVVIGNEPNHAKEWGGGVKPGEYANFLIEFSKAAKDRSENYFILPAGLDASAINNRTTMNEINFLQAIINNYPDYFEHINGWTSHSYPNPDYVGPADGYGKGSVRTFLWELSYLKSLGLSKNLPVFITETGWVQKNNNQNGLDPAVIGNNFINAYENAWSEEGVIAVTPFILNYPETPFDAFSWIDNSKNPYPFFEVVKNMPKTKGEPIQKVSGEISGVVYPVYVSREKLFSIIIDIKNTGQNIWGSNFFEILSEDNCLSVFFVQKEVLEPYNNTTIIANAKAGIIGNDQVCKIYLSVNNKRISQSYDLKFSVGITPTGYIKANFKPNIKIITAKFIRFVNDFIH